MLSTLALYRPGREFLLPCEIGELYANDIELSCAADTDGEHPAQITSKEWDLAPQLKILAAAGDYDSHKQSNGFGREVKNSL
jgi:hypothetical protein